MLSLRPETDGHLGQAAVSVLPRLTRYLVAELHRAPQASGLSWPQFRILGFLAERDYRASELAADLEIGRSTVTAVSDGLVRRGLVARVRDLPGDRRGVLMQLTDEGRVVHAALKQRAVHAVEQLLSTATLEEREALGRGLAALERSLCHHGEPLGHEQPDQEPS